MEPLLTDEQRLLQDSVARMLAQAGGVKRARGLRGKGGGFDREMHARMGAEGWFGLLLPAEHGGLGLGLTELALVLVEAGRVLAPEPIGAANVAALTLAACPDAALRERHLEGVVAGQRIVVPAFADRRIGVAATACAEGLVSQVAHGEAADAYLLEAEVGAAAGFFLQDRDASSRVGADAPTVDGRSYASVRVDLARATRVAGEPGVVAAFDLALFAAAAELVGVMSAALDMTVEYLKTRKQFGRAIGSFQALQHRAVDDLARIVSARSLLFQVAAQGLPLSPRMASALKAHCSGCALEVTKSAIQMHGAIGFTDEHDIGLYLKRAMWLSVWLGNEAVHRRRFLAASG